MGGKEYPVTIKTKISSAYEESKVKEASGSITITVKGISDLKKADAQMLKDTDFNIEGILREDGVELDEGGSTYKRNSISFQADNSDMKTVQSFAKRQTQLSKDTAKLIKPKMDYGDLYEERVDSLYVAGLLSSTAKPNSSLQYIVYFISETNKNDKSDDGDGLDAVQPKAVKKKFKDRKDKDIDNDGDTDNSDKFLHKKRKAISKAISKKDESKLYSFVKNMMSKRG